MNLPDPIAVSGQLHIGIRVAPNGEPCVLFQWPDGSGLMLPKQQALCFAFTTLAVVRNLFRDVQALEQAVLAAKGEADMLLANTQPTVQ
jgi:hypothetical protein